MKEGTEREQEFLLAMIGFLKDTFRNMAEAINNLAELHEKYPEEYEKMMELRANPMRFLEDLENIKMDEKLKSSIILTLFRLFVKLASMSDKLNNVYFLSVDEQKELATQLETFTDEMEKELNRLKEEIK